MDYKILKFVAQANNIFLTFISAKSKLVEFIYCYIDTTRLG